MEQHNIDRKVLEMEESIRKLKKSIDGLYFIVMMLGIGGIIATLPSVVNKLR